MLKLTQVIYTNIERTIYLAAHHIVGIFPSPKGSFVGLTTDRAEDGAASVAPFCAGHPRST